MAWLGRKKLAFIPLSRTNSQPPDIIPTDWAEQITQRVFFDKDRCTGADRSLRAYIHTVSSGLADLDVSVQPPETIAGQDIAPDALEATMGDQLRANGFDGAAIVMLGGPNGGETIGYWSRFTMRDDLGHWVGELVHQAGLCNLPDLFDYAGDYPSGDNMGAFDEEAGYDATHPSAWTKRAVGWLDPSAVALHPGGVAEYTLYSVSLIQPPPTGRVTAVQIGAEVPYLMVEARLKADQFDINIPNEGVIVYRVQTTDPLGTAQNEIAPLALLTKKALTAGQSFRTDGVTIDVDSAVMGGGFSIQVETIATGQLLSYGDAGVSDPVIVGNDDWLDFKFLFAGENLSGENRIYAVDHSGQLLSYGDDGTPGNVSAPVTVGFGGWLDFKFLFAGKNLSGENRIYAVNQGGQLLSYGDDATPGNVSDPVIVGNDDWLDFKFLFAGQNLSGENRIYAVTQGKLLSYGDDGTPGNVSHPVTVGNGDWLDLKLMFAGTNFSGDNRIYGVNQSGQLLSYQDAGNVGNVWGRFASLGGWLDFKFLFAGQNLSGENRIYAVNQSGQLLSYGNTGIPGNVSDPAIIGVNQSGQLQSYGSTGIPANVSDPAIVGFGGWLDFKFLFAGQNLSGENRIYAVNQIQNGQLLSYGDDATPGNVSDPVIVGNDDWLAFKFLFAGKNLSGENRIYAVNQIQNGQLLSYGDDATPGNVSDPVIVGNDDWLAFKFLFAGKNLSGENRIYAVNQGGQLLSYGDDATPGNVSDPVIVGNDDWLAFKFLFAGKNLSGENRIYAVNQGGQLLSYGDDGTSGNVSAPVTVGFGGWLNFKFLFAGKNLSGDNRIYAVVA